MTLTQISETEYRCVSDSGQVYSITGVPIPDEYDSAMRCGIDEDDPFVQQIPLVWSCDCPAGSRNRACKHMRAFAIEIMGEDAQQYDAREARDRAEAQARREPPARRQAELEAIGESTQTLTPEMFTCRAGQVEWAGEELTDPIQRAAVERLLQQCNNTARDCERSGTANVTQYAGPNTPARRFLPLVQRAIDALRTINTSVQEK